MDFEIHHTNSSFWGRANVLTSTARLAFPLSSFTKWLPTSQGVEAAEAVSASAQRQVALQRLWGLQGHKLDAGLRRNEVTYTSAIRACAEK